MRMTKELNMLKQMQQMILPRADELKAIADLDIVGYMEPADEVGGDYYDILYIDGIVTIGIGDVTGHGLESGILMVMTQTAIRTLQEIRELDPVKFLDVVNRTIFKNVSRMNSQKNLTLLIITYFQGKFSVSGQHEEVIVFRKGGNVKQVETVELGFPIGIYEEISDFIYQEHIELEVGDGIVLYTDGIPEAFNIHKQQYGLERLHQVISQNWQGTALQIKQAIIDDVKQFIGDQKVFDDITLVVIKQLPFEKQEISEIEDIVEQVLDEDELEENIEEDSKKINQSKKPSFFRNRFK